MPDFRRFAKRYARFLRLIELISRFAPEKLQHCLAKIVGRHANPYNLSAGILCSTITTTISCSQQTTDVIWKRWLANHTSFALTALSYEKLDLDWLHQRVQVQSPDLLTKIVYTGGLVLTYHTHHQNTLAAILGIAGGTISPVAAPAASGSPLYDEIGDYIDRINEGSQQHFNGGAYLYTDNLRRVQQQVRARLMQGELILSLCDFHQTSNAQPHYFMDRLITPPTGVVRLALQSRVPIYLALLHSDEKGKLQLLLHESTSHQNAHAVLADYLDFLAKVVVVTPEVWQGWEWFGNLVPTTPEIPEKVEAHA